MSDALDEIVIPDRPTFKAQEVCDLLKLQSYVLRSWENEFAELGVARAPGAPRVYRRADVELAVRIRQLVFGEGLTLAGVRRRLEAERPAPPEEGEESPPSPAPAPAGPPPAARAAIEEAKRALRGVLDLLGERPAVPGSAVGKPKAVARGRVAEGAGDLFAQDAPPTGSGRPEPAAGAEDAAVGSGSAGDEASRGRAGSRRARR
jgi:DNA-binding transcriptional MerR regulator